jgi:hypothetical protein
MRLSRITRLNQLGFTTANPSQSIRFYNCSRSPPELPSATFQTLWRHHLLKFSGSLTEIYWRSTLNLHLTCWRGDHTSYPCMRTSLWHTLLSALAGFLSLSSLLRSRCTMKQLMVYAESRLPSLLTYPFQIIATPAHSSQFWYWHTFCRHLQQPLPRHDKSRLTTTRWSC